MKNTGMVRRIDDLGRIVIPKELRNTLKIKENQALEMYVEDEHIILRKHNDTCDFCSEIEDLIQYKSGLICKKCFKEIQELKSTL